MKLRLMVLFLLLNVRIINSQTSLESGIWLGGTNYYGDLAADHGSLKEVGPGIGLFGKFMFDSKFGLRLSIGRLALTGSDMTSGIHVDRGWEFSTTITELAGVLEYHPLGKSRIDRFGHFQKNQISPYIFWGIGHASGYSRITTPSTDKILFPESGDRSNYTILPIGGGIRLDLSRFCIVSLELGKRAVLSDYLDGVSVYGNDLTTDWYLFGGIAISLLINAQKDH